MYQNNIQDRRLDNIDHHIEIINGELGSVKENMSGLKTDVAWIKKFITIAITLSIGIGGLVVGIANLLM